MFILCLQLVDFLLQDNDRGEWSVIDSSPPFLKSPAYSGPKRKTRYVELLFTKVMVSCVDCVWYDVDEQHAPCSFCTGALGARLPYIRPVCIIETWWSDSSNDLPF